MHTEVLLMLHSIPSFPDLAHEISPPALSTRRELLFLPCSLTHLLTAIGFERSNCECTMQLLSLSLLEWPVCKNSALNLIEVLAVTGWEHWIQCGVIPNLTLATWHHNSIWFFYFLNFKLALNLRETRYYSSVFNLLQITNITKFSGSIQIYY